MPVSYKKGNLLDCDENIIIHGCNAQGVMNSGVAKLIREKYPTAYETYLTYKPILKSRLGTVHFTIGDDGKAIGNAITQEYYGRDKNIVYANYNAIRDVFKYINDTFSGDSVAIPKIGAGLANGDWNIISKIIEEECRDVNIVVYEL